VVNTTCGKVQGQWREDVAVFKGIPYGASTAGAGRFRPPRPPAPWSGVLSVLDDSPQAPQRDPDAAAGQSRPGHDSTHPFATIEPDWPRLPESEDCLELDVWTPAVDGGKRPVMVWFHGGGFFVGSAAGLWQDGGELSRQGDVVIVSPNHRLNVLGHLFLDPLSADFAGSGNAGLLDLVLALTWVRDNIARFGGDSGNVTIMGQSGGGQKVSMLLASPQAAGLFHRAIIQSGPAPKALEPLYATQMAQRLLTQLAVGSRNLTRLETLSTDQIMRAYFKVFRETGGYGVLGILQGFAPVVDGRILPHHPFSDGAPVISADVPLLIGTTRTEMTLNTLRQDPNADAMDEPGLRARLAGLFGAGAERVLAAYRAAHPGLPRWELYALITSDWPTRLYSIQIAQAKASLHRAPVFMYRTDWDTPVGEGKLLAPHAIDLSLVLEDTAYSASFDGGGADARRLSDRMSGAWLAFARSGNPNTAGLPPWPSYAPDTWRATLLFDNDCRVVNDPDGADRRALDPMVSGTGT